MCIRDRLLAHGAHATPVASIDNFSLPVYFTPDGGAFGLGVLTFDGVTSIVVENEGSQTPVDDVSFYLTADLCADLPIGELANGLFLGGEVLLQDASGSNLLTGTTLTFALTEDIDNTGVLLATGSLDVLSGSLQAILGDTGVIYDVEIVVDTALVGDFSQPFTGFTGLSHLSGEEQGDISAAAMPVDPQIPEPATLAFLGIGLAGLLIRRRHER